MRPVHNIYGKLRHARNDGICRAVSKHAAPVFFIHVEIYSGIENVQRSLLEQHSVYQVHSNTVPDHPLIKMKIVLQRLFFRQPRYHNSPLIKHFIYQKTFYNVFRSQKYNGTPKFPEQ